jgi:hypothetical protein
MAVRSGNHLQRRHEGYLRSDLLVATLRSIREVNIFVPRMTHQNFLHPEPTHPASCATSFTDPLARGGVLAEGVRLESVSTQQRKIHLRGYTIKVGGGLGHRTLVSSYECTTCTCSRPNPSTRWIRIQGSLLYYFVFFILSDPQVLRL